MSTTVLRGSLAAAVALLALAAPATALASATPDASSTATSASATPAPTPTATTPPVQALTLPEPTGPHPVGTTALHLVDDSRPDPWVAGQSSRQLMVSLWYPARTSHGRRAQYMTAQESALLLKEHDVEGVPPEILSGTWTNGLVDAPPLRRGRGLPLVVLSPGFTQPRSSLTALAEDLASRGYVVAGIDHTHETATTFPDGHTETCTVCGSEGSPGFGEKSTRTRAADVSFVLDRLTGPNPAWKHARLIDPSRIAMAGHSIGGNSATWTMLNDPRVRAGVNMDGTFWIPIPDRGLSRPFLLLGSQESTPQGRDTTWPRDWRHMTGWKRWLTIDGTHHGSFTDHPLLLAQIGMNDGSPTSGSRAMEITRRYVGAFLDLHLRKRSQPLLDRPSPRHPEVRFWR
ncbi:alpha/beta hydrolase family protein [Streptosporangium carneum]|uniref:Esterase n=1 Tax=Streptosporangium carneum TaxID=47481 RepID=A0A9W6MEX2_9ACTN|nr:alpha/beta hydrolase [Streptosporangium carneum]GLK11263.1 esterase [Streptosporangium carneum]